MTALVLVPRRISGTHWPCYAEAADGTPPDELPPQPTTPIDMSNTTNPLTAILEEARATATRDGLSYQLARMVQAARAELIAAKLDGFEDRQRLDEVEQYLRPNDEQWYGADARLHGWAARDGHRFSIEVGPFHADEFGVMHGMSHEASSLREAIDLYINAKETDPQRRAEAWEER